MSSPVFLFLLYVCPLSTVLFVYCFSISCLLVNYLMFVYTLSTLSMLSVCLLSAFYRPDCDCSLCCLSVTCLPAICLLAVCNSAVWLSALWLSVCCQTALSAVCLSETLYQAYRSELRFGHLFPPAVYLLSISFSCFLPPNCQLPVCLSTPWQLSVC